MAYSKPKGDVLYYIPKKKKPIAYSSQSTNDLIVILSRLNNTIQDVYDAINYDDEAKNVIKKFIDLGYGNSIAKDWFK